MYLHTRIQLPVKQQNNVQIPLIELPQIIFITPTPSTTLLVLTLLLRLITDSSLS